MLQQQEPEPQPTSSTTAAPAVETETAAPPAPPPAAEILLEPPPAFMEEILGLLKTLKRRDYFGQMASNLYDDNWKTRIPASWLLRTLCGYSEWQWKESAVAAWALGQIHLMPEQRQEAVKTLSAFVANQKDSIYRRSGNRLGSGIARCLMTGTCVGADGTASICLVALLMALPTIGSGDFGSLIGFGIFYALLGAVFASLFFAAALSPLVLPISVALDVTHANTVRAIAAYTLGRLQSPYSVGALAKAAMEHNSRVSTAAASALSAVLPTLTPEHYGRLSAETVPNLCHALAYSGPVPPQFGTAAFLRLSLLDALEKVGDGRAIASLQAFLAQTTNQSVRARAEQVLAVLVARHKRHQDSRLLLRGATGPDTPSEQLLRAASGTESVSPDELLRPHEEG